MEKHQLTELLKTVSQQNIQTMELQDLADLYTQILTPISYLYDNPNKFAGMLEKFEEVFEKIQEEFERRGVMIVNLFDVIETQPELVKETLEAYNLNQLLELLLNLTDPAHKKLELLVKKEIVVRIDSNPGMVN